MHRGTSRLLLTHGLLILAAAGARAQTRPLLTEEATTAPAHRLVLELGGDYIHAEPSFLTGLTRDRLDGPSLALVYSPGDNVEVDVAWVTRVRALDEPGRGDVSDWGDVSLRTKLRFVRAAGWRPDVAARYAVSLAQTRYSTGLGPNTLSTRVQLLVSEPLRVVTLHGNFGVALQDEIYRLHEQRDFIAYGLALECPLAARLALLAELAGLHGSSRPGTAAHAEMRVGFRLGGGRVRWDAALRRGFGKADGTWGATAGATWTIRR
jgi:hypothetical protein